MIALPLRSETKAALFAVVVISLSAAAGGGGSGAYLSDSVTSEGNTIEAETVGPITVDVDFRPSHLPVDERGTATVLVHHPERSRVDGATVSVAVDGRSIDTSPRTCGETKCVLALDARAVVDAFADDATAAELVVTGVLEDGTRFEGTTTIRLERNATDRTRPHDGATSRTADHTGNETDTDATTTDPPDGPSENVAPANGETVAANATSRVGGTLPEKRR